MKTQELQKMLPSTQPAASSDVVIILLDFNRNCQFHGLLTEKLQNQTRGMVKWFRARLTFLSQISNQKPTFIPIEFLNDKEIVLTAIAKHPDLLSLSLKRWKKDLALMREASLLNSRVLFHADLVELKRDKEFMLQVVQKDPSAFGYACKALRNDRDFKERAQKRQEVTEECVCERKESVPMDFTDLEMVLGAVRQIGFSLKHATDFKNVEQVVLEALSQNGASLQFASTEMKNNRQVVLHAVRHGRSLLYASENLKRDRDVVLEAVKYHGLSLKDASKDLKLDRELVMTAIRQDARIYQYLPVPWKNEKEVAMEAFSKRGSMLEYASKNLQNDKTLVLAAVQNNGECLKFASKGLQRDEEVLFAALKQSPNVLTLDIFPHDMYKEDKSFALEMVAKDGKFLKYFPKWQADKDVISEAVKQDHRSLHFAQLDKSFALELVAKDGTLLEYLSKWKADKEVVLEAVKQNHRSIRHAAPEIICDRQVTLEVIRQHAEYYKTLQTTDEDLLMEAVKVNGTVLEYCNTTNGSIRLEACLQNGYVHARASPSEMQNLQRTRIEKCYFGFDYWTAINQCEWLPFPFSSHIP